VVNLFSCFLGRRKKGVPPDVSKAAEGVCREVRGKNADSTAFVKRKQLRKVATGGGKRNSKSSSSHD